MSKGMVSFMIVWGGLTVFMFLFAITGVWIWIVKGDSSGLVGIYFGGLMGFGLLILGIGNLMDKEWAKES